MLCLAQHNAFLNGDIPTVKELKANASQLALGREAAQPDQYYIDPDGIINRGSKQTKNPLNTTNVCVQLLSYPKDNSPLETFNVCLQWTRAWRMLNKTNPHRSHPQQLGAMPSAQWKHHLYPSLPPGSKHTQGILWFAKYGFLLLPNS